MDAIWLNKKFEQFPNKTKTGLADKLKLEPPAISKILNGTRQIKAQEYILMREYFGLDERSLKDQEGKQSSYTLSQLDHSPTLDEISNPGQEQNNHWVLPAQIINKRTKAPPNLIKIFEIKESVMEPDFFQGESVLIDLSDQSPSPPGTFILHDGFGYMLRLCEFVPKSNPPEIKISANKKGFQTQTLSEDDIEIIGRVIAKLQML